MEEHVTEEREVGARIWVVADGYLPAGGIEGERALEPHESYSILNAGEADAQIEIMLYFAEREPAGPYRATLAAERCLHLRTNDLDTPERVPRDTDYAAVIRADRPVVVQHTRLDSRRASFALMTTLAHPAG
jgi:hypothetical protein